MKRRIFLALPLLAGTAFAHSAKVGDISIGHAWALPTQQNDGQVFMPLVNMGKVPDALVAARADIAAYVEFRPYNRYDELPLREFYLAPKKPFAMRPTAYHLRLVGLKRPLSLGDRFPIILDFLNSGELEIEVHVENSPGD